MPSLKKRSAGFAKAYQTRLNYSTADSTRANGINLKGLVISGNRKPTRMSAHNL